jgi:Asp-tRNA(Asn)/Glu-tRNA(Gln) amidotransferase A subunit family amidase
MTSVSLFIIVSRIPSSQSVDEPETYRDAPISLQLVGQRYEDEKLIQALEFIQQHVPALKKTGA